MNRMRRLSVVLLLAALAAPAGAQDRAATLADIRQQIGVLDVQIQGLKRELSTTGTAMTQGGGAGTGPIARLDAIETALRQLTARTEELQFRIDAIVADGTNRIGDLEFRLTELEGGDLGAVGQTRPLGGGSAPLTPSTSIPEPDSGPELAVGEQADLDAAAKLLTDGTPADAFTALSTFLDTYPRSPLAAEAELLRGDALIALGNLPDGGRSYLASYTKAQNVNPGLAAEALLKLGQTLGKLDQAHEACISLGQVIAQYPGTTAAGAAETALAGMRCP